MHTDNSIESSLRRMVSGVIAGTLSNAEIKEQLCTKLEPKDIGRANNLLLTDCYNALKHMGEERVSAAEWAYFAQCLDGARQYDPEDRLHVLLAQR